MAFQKRHLKYHAAGTTVVEMALLSPLFVLIILGMMEMGWLMMKESEVTNAARAGARYAVLPSVTTESQVQSSASPAYKLLYYHHLDNGSQIQVTGIAGAAAGDLVTVTVSVPYQNVRLMGIVPFLPSSLTLKASVSMAKEGPTS